MSLFELAKRCEQATGSDRDLDEAIRAALGLDTIAFLHPAYGVDEYEAAEFTASLDAAKTLLPEGCRWSLKSEFSDGIDSALEYWANCSPGFGIRREQGYGKTDALALCAAALKARAASGIDTRQSQDGETRLGPKDESATGEAGTPNPFEGTTFETRAERAKRESGDAQRPPQ